LYGKNYYFFYEKRKIFFMSPSTYYKGRVHVDLGTNLTGSERQFCLDFDQGKLKPNSTGLSFMSQNLMGSLTGQGFFSPKQCGDGDPVMPLGSQLKAESVFERIALMCDESQVPNCIRYAQYSKWAKQRWSDEGAIRSQISDVFDQGMESRIRDFLSLGGNLRATHSQIPCLLFRNNYCGDLLSPSSSSKYSNKGEEWFMTQAVNCDAHHISPCIFYALYSNWARQKWSQFDKRKEALFKEIKKQRDQRVRDVIKQERKRTVGIGNLRLPKLF
jgi:hypothetical protein